METNTKKCSIIGHRTIKITNDIKEKVRIIMLDLIKLGVKTFIFGSNGDFNELCYNVVTELKRDFSDVNRVYVRAEYLQVNSSYEKYLLSRYEESYYYDKGINLGKINYIKRNEDIISKSDVCLFYYDKNYVPTSKTKSGTMLAYNYASKQNKRIINVFSCL